MAPVGPVELDEVQIVLGPRLRDLTEPPPRRRYGRVFVGTTRAARGMAFDVVFVPGLAENVFPGKILEDPLLLDEQRRGARAAGPAHRARTRRSRAARAPARGGCGAPAGVAVVPSRRRREGASARALVLRPRGAEGGRGPAARTRCAHTRAPSRRQAPGSAGPRRRIRASPSTRPSTISRSWRRSCRPTRRRPPARRSYLLEANPHLARALRARGRRWLRSWKAADGLVDPDELARAALARHQMSERAVLADRAPALRRLPVPLLPAGDPEAGAARGARAIDVLDPLTRGGLFHDVQFGVLGGCATPGCCRCVPTGLEQAFEVLDAVLDAEARTRQRAARAGDPASLGRTRSTGCAPTCASGCGARQPTTAAGCPSASSSRSGCRPASESTATRRA